MNFRQLNLAVLILLCTSLMLVAQSTAPTLNDQMWEAARKGDAASVTALLDKGADVNAKFRYGATALFKAAERGNVEVVKVLLARGADVKVRDTFYGATAMTWALDNKHAEVVRALLEKDQANVGEVLMTGVRENHIDLVRVGLSSGSPKGPALTQALAAATAGPDVNAEIVDALKKAGAMPPPEVDAAILQTYVGKYKSDQGTEIVFTQQEGKFIATVTGQPPIVLMAVDKITFKPVAFDGIVVTFKFEGEKVTSFELQQGPTPTMFKRQ